MKNPVITNQKPCESCNAIIRATKANTFCDKCLKLINHLNENWHVTGQKKPRGFCGHHGVIYYSRKFKGKLSYLNSQQKSKYKNLCSF